MTISSKDNEMIKRIKKLKEKKYREEYNEFIVEGIKMVEEAIIEKAKIKTIIICDDCKTTGCIPNEIMYEIAKYDCIYVSEKVFGYITDVINPQGIMAVIQKPECAENEIDFEEENFLILDNIQDPGNIGTILRSAAAFGINRLIFSSDCADLYSQKVIRSSMGAIFKLNFDIVDNLPEALMKLKKQGKRVISTTLKDNSLKLGECLINKSDVFVIGNEGHGISS